MSCEIIREKNMVNLIILNSSFIIQVTLQHWSSDNLGPLFDALAKKGFSFSQPSPMQQMQGQATPIARRGTTTALAVDHITRRVALSITNENTDPSRNIRESLEVLESIGFPSKELVSRIDIQGNITVKIETDSVSAFVPNVVSTDFVKKAGEIFGRKITPIGMRIASTERFAAGVSKSPFVILIEPLFTDDSDTKFLAQVILSTGSSEYALEFTQRLYDRLKQIIRAFKGE